MSKLCPFIVVLALAAPTPAAAADAGVAALQVALRERGAYTGPIDGLAGPATSAGVLRVQRGSRLVADGIVGPRTLHVLHARSVGSRIVERGSRGWDVASLQFLLATHGFPCGTFDGHLGAHTEAALLRFQRWAGLAADGRAGPSTFAALRAPPPQAPLALARPVDAPPSDGFGPRGVRFHTGVDFEVPAGTSVRAAAAGRVRWAGWHDPGYGVVVTVDHGGGAVTWYAHLERTDVRPGARVAAGVLVGRAGSTGTATGPHLHFELRVRGASIDPLPALGLA